MIYDVSIHILPSVAMLDLNGSVGDIAPRLLRLGLFEPAPGRMATAGPVEVLRAGREHWLVRAPLDDEARLMAGLLETPPEADTLVVPVSDAYVFFGISGPHARQVLAIASPLDTDPAAFPVDGATFTEAFGQKALVMRRGKGFEMAFERSYAPMVSDYFSRINGGP